MPLAEEAQAEWKRRLLEESLQRIAQVRNVRIEETVRSPSTTAYRNKLELTFGRSREGQPALGFHSASRRGEVVDIERCLLQDDSANRVLLEVRSFFLAGPGRSERGLSSHREAPRLVIRRSFSSGEILVALRTAPGSFRSATTFARRLVRRVPEVCGVVRILARPGRRGGSRTVTLAGRPWVGEGLGGTSFRLPAAVFFQVNPLAAEHLVRLVREMSAVRNGSRVVELYGGVGAYGFALAREGARVTVCEADAGAVACGRRTAREHPGSRVRFVHSDVGVFLGRSPAPAAEIVVANPPRTGLARGVTEGIAQVGAARVIVVSCDPATLARDLARLTRGGYRVGRVVPVDLFPQTPHLEAVAELERAG
jgi:23S rRNA (uracil-5-)-methyltransferase RumA